VVDETPTLKLRTNTRRIRLTLGLCVCAVAGIAPAQSYVATGQCRAGVPNGGYELRMPDGRLRVVGAFAQGRMTGTFIFWTSGGARTAVLPFDSDARTGTLALWYVAPDDRSEAGRKLEAPYIDDQPHGIKRSWYPDGTLRAEYRYEHGSLVEARAWTERGAPLPDAEARGLALRDADNDERYYASLVAIVRGNLPACGPAPLDAELPRS
jgi:antitoxin component YwqK of YwqJK toxin-antitoxin module